MSETYTRTHGITVHSVTVEVLPGAGCVIEHPRDSVRGAGYGRKHLTADPCALAREIGQHLEAAGYTRAAR